LHPAIIELKKRIENGADERIHDVDLTYITSRGRWYHTSWKGDDQKSGGIATNIGVHFYDMLSFVFGPVVRNVVHCREAERAAGNLDYKRARVRWFLSIDSRDLPKNLPPDKKTFRSLTIDSEEFEFSEGFTDLHTRSYEEILAGRGFCLDEVRSSIETVSAIRAAPLTAGKGEQHPFLKGPANA
jgi:UDP-N-acetyl-2-amino-2-deoxyglucuronate dehydrogenase